MPCASPTNAAPLRNGRRRVPPAPRALPRRRLRFRRLHLRLRTRARRAAAGPRRSPAGHLRGLRRRLGRLRGERPRIQRGRLRAAHPSDAAPSSWEKPRGPLPLSLFGAGDDQEEEGPGGPLPTDTAPQRAVSFTTDGSRPADLKDLIAGLYGSQPSPTAGAADAGPQEEPEDGEGLGDDDWEFTAATAEPADQDRGGRALGDGIGKIEGITKSLSTDQEVQSSLTSVDEKLNHFRQNYC